MDVCLSAGLNAVVSKASAGAAEVLEILTLRNPTCLLTTLQVGILCVLGYHCRCNFSLYTVHIFHYSTAFLILRCDNYNVKSVFSC